MKALSEQGRKATFSLLSKINNDFYNVETLLSLFDTYVASIVNYGSEIWGSHKANKNLFIFIFEAYFKGAKRNC